MNYAGASDLLVGGGVKVQRLMCVPAGWNAHTLDFCGGEGRNYRVWHASGNGYSAFCIAGGHVFVLVHPAGGEFETLAFELRGGESMLQSFLAGENWWEIIEFVRSSHGLMVQG